MTAQGRTIVVMGTCGVGKTTLAAALARRTGRPFLEGDSFHPPQNVAAMRAQRPLTDEMRAGWLDAIAAAARATPGAIVSCSALKESYRDRLRAGIGPITLIHLYGDRALLAERMLARTDHFMPVSLLDSQLALLEPPAPGPDCLHLDVAAPTGRLVDAALAFLGAGVLSTHDMSDGGN
ncbi:gluconokinase [Roseivivax isoporae]|uniref:Gluconokinase n=1 Tax=Roseivivax isoporae LMG 25204 TaxID=1449351 RepID=X7F7Z3_9RHOB|nr:gluconokinase [Roseivivax isoporae]ETX28853.1 hypothetical protein RISW2_03860 [Roseivivax isoporae LMG 25204]